MKMFTCSPFPTMFSNAFYPMARKRWDDKYGKVESQ